MILPRDVFTPIIMIWYAADPSGEPYLAQGEDCISKGKKLFLVAKYSCK